MDPEERARRREERRRQREEDERDTAETNGPTKENGLSNEIEEDESERLRQEKSRPAEKPKKKLNLLGKVSKGRKKEILQMMLQKARGDLQLEEQEAAAEKAKYIGENVKESSVESMNKEQLRKLCEALHDQLQLAEGEKFDLEIKVKRRDLQISNLKVKANETRGKFAMPKLKTVAKK